MSAVFQDRISRLKAFLPDASQAILITDEVNIGYFTGFFHSEGCLLATQNSVHLLVDFRYAEAARQKANGCRVSCYQKLTESLTGLLAAENIQAVVTEAGHITVSRFRLFQRKLREQQIDCFADEKLDAHIGALRTVKDKTELDKIAAAQRIAEQAYLELLNDVKPGVTERELAARLQFYMRQKGAEDVSFDLITICGKKTALPHGVPSDDVLRAGDFLTCDFGAVFDGYHSDTTRTVAVGYADDDMRRVYAVVLQAQLAALETVRPGALCSAVDKAARDIITAAGYGEHFGHAVGHGVGLCIHEQPAVSFRSGAVLQEGMVITDEPGIYLPGRFGVRIEDMLCVTENGYFNFVNLPKELLIL